MSIDWESYQVHRVDDAYYLVDVRQTGENYRPPICISGSGAMICRAMIAGKTTDDIVEAFVEEYDILKNEAESDIEGFLEELDGKIG